MVIRHCPLLRVIKHFRALLVTERANLSNASMRGVGTKIGTLDWASLEVQPTHQLIFRYNLHVMPEDQTPETEQAPPSAPPPQNPSKPPLEHPLTITLVSFLLTGIIGASITYVVQRRNADTERDARHYEASTTAIAAFSDSLYTRYTR